MKKRLPNKEWLYLKIAGRIEKQIRNGVLKAGDKLPSIRMICREHGVSMSTAQFAYYELEAKSLVEARPQSGYYVSRSLHLKLAIPESSRPLHRVPEKDIGKLFSRIMERNTDEGFTQFSMGIPAVGLLPTARLSKGVQQAVRTLAGGGTSMEPLSGNEKLRRQVARWSFHWQGNLAVSDILTTPGCMSAISYCLQAITKRGDRIAVESPCFFGILQLAQSLGLSVIELPTSPETGVDLDSLKRVLQKGKLAACLFVSNFNNPFGSLMPESHKREAVRLLAQYQVPLIEDDLYGDIYFGEKRPVCCKSFDEEGMVLLCSSVSKTLAPGYRVGWVAPGKYIEQVKKVKLVQSLGCSAITQEVIAEFLENGRYEAHLRKLRRTLQANYLNYVRIIGEHFPAGSKISRPQGGLSLWVALPKQANTIELYNEALGRKISFLPGSLFTLQQQFDHCMRLGFGLEWNAKTESALKMLGKLAREAI